MPAPGGWGACSRGRCLVLGGVCSGGVPGPGWGGGLLPGGCLLPGDVCSQGVSAPREGCLFPGGLLPGGVCSGGACWTPSETATAAGGTHPT